MTFIETVRSEEGSGVRAIEILRGLAPHNLKYPIAAAFWIWYGITGKKYPTIESAIEVFLKEDRLAEVNLKGMGDVQGYFIPWPYFQGADVQGYVVDNEGTLINPGMDYSE